MIYPFYKGSISSSLTLLIVSAFSIARAAQDAKRPSSACQAAKDQESLRYINTTVPLTRQADQIKKRANQQKASCGHDRGCIEKIELEEQQALHQNTREAADENARHEKAMVDIEHQPPCEQFSLPAAPCDKARSVEMHRYSLDMATLEKKKIDDRNLWEHDLIGCGVTGGPCLREADRKQQLRLASWQKEVDTENQRHQQELRSIAAGVGCELPREQPDLVSASTPERPRDPPELVGSDPRQSKRQPLDPEKKRQLIDTETKRHLSALADILRSMDQENQRHREAVRRAGSNSKLVAEADQLYQTHMHVLRVELDEEGRRFEAAMSNLKAQ